MGSNGIGLICPNSSPCIYPSSGIRSPEKQPPQIGHLPAHERKQFRVICYLKKALWISEGLSRNWPFLVSLRLTVPAS